MVTALLLLFFSFGQTKAPTPPPVQQSGSATPNGGTKVDPEVAAKLLKVRRIYVDTFGDDAISKQLQAMVINALTQSKRFIITENKERADAVLKGTGLEKTSQELHAISEATSVGGAAGAHSGSVSGGVATGAGVADSQASTETINESRLAVRLVSTDGDVIWTTTKESKGAKYKGASADVADQIVKQLLWDLDKVGASLKQ